MKIIGRLKSIKQRLYSIILLLREYIHEIRDWKKTGYNRYYLYGISALPTMTILLYLMAPFLFPAIWIAIGAMLIIGLMILLICGRAEEWIQKSAILSSCSAIMIVLLISLALYEIKRPHPNNEQTEHRQTHLQKVRQESSKTAGGYRDDVLDTYRR